MGEIWFAKLVGGLDLGCLKSENQVFYFHGMLSEVGFDVTKRKGENL